MVQNHKFRWLRNIHHRRITLLIFKIVSSRHFQSFRISRAVGRLLFRDLSIQPKRLGGSIIRVNPNDAAHRIIYNEFFSVGSYPLERVSFKPDLIVDCGAHIGLFTLLAAAKFPGARMFAFEPNPINADRFNEHIQSNRVSCELVRAAVTDHSGSASFASYSGCDGRIQECEGEAKTYKVLLVDLAEFLRANQTESLLLKIDVEGEERILLPAILSTLPKKTAIYFETHFGDARWVEAKVLLENDGFYVEKLDSHEECCDGFAIRLG